MSRAALSAGEQQFSRLELVRSPLVWSMLCGTFAFFAVSSYVLSFVMPGIDADHLRLLGGALALISVGLFAGRAPRPDSLPGHLLLMLVYVGPAVAMMAFSPHGSAVVASAMFAGPLAAMWATRPRVIAAHLTGATIALFIPAALGLADTVTLVACIALAPSLWVIAGCVALIQGAMEIQSAQLAFLLRRDPLTGAGNRRLLDECLAQETAHPERPCTVLTLDLNGFKAINDDHGHAEGDELLRAVAAALTASVRSGETVIRQGGDEFCVVLPGTDAEGAGPVIAEIDRRLEAITHRGVSGSISSGIGRATFPDDGTTVDALLAVADGRLRADKAAGVPRRGTGRSAAPPAAAPSPVALPEQRHPALRDGVGRPDLQHHRWIWTAHASMYLVYGLIGAGVVVWAPEIVTPAFPWALGLGVAIGITYLVCGPTTIGTRVNHGVIALTYLMPLLVLITGRPGGAVAIGCLIFVGPLTASRLVDRREIAAHLAIASVLLLAVIPTGLVDPSTMVAILMLVGVLWILGVCTAFVLEGAEAQTLRLRELAGHDPLTGAANRRSLIDVLARELPHHGPERPLSVITLDLNGFKQLNDTMGHAAGDDLLRRVTEVLRDGARANDVVARQGGDEFCVVLPGVPAEQLPARVAALRTALGRLRCGGRPLTTGVGSATFPDDAQDADALLARADERLLADKNAMRRAGVSAGRARPTRRDAGRLTGAAGPPAAARSRE